MAAKNKNPIVSAYPYDLRLLLRVGMAQTTHGPKIAEITRVTGGVLVTYENGAQFEHLGAMRVEYAVSEPEDEKPEA
jgi:hypothetical protein